MKVQIWEISCNRRALEVAKIKNYFVANGCHVIWENKKVDSEADVIYFSTCAFTQTAEEYALNTLRLLEEEKKESCKIIIGGCLPKINLEPIKDYFSFGPRDYDKIDKLFPNFKYKYTDFSETYTYGPKDVQIPSSMLDKLGKTVSKKQTILEIEQYIAEQENDIENFRIQCMIGCPGNCTYCAIKFAVGKVSSISEEEIMKAVERAITLGYKKVFFEGDCLGAYGMDIGTDIGKLLNKVIDRIKDIEIEVSVADVAPFYLNKCMKQIQELAFLGKLNHFYVPIQSANDRILGLMRRRCDNNSLKEMLIELKSKCPHVRLGTSVIVGFPGETEEEFEDTINFCVEVGFDYIWPHYFSVRKGTESEKFNDWICEETQYLRIIRLKEKVEAVWKNASVSIPSLNIEDYELGTKAQG